MSRIIWCLVVASVVLVNAGCRNTCNRPGFFCRNDQPPTKQVIVPPPPAPIVGVQAPPQGGFPIAPQGGFPVAPQGQTPQTPPIVIPQGDQPPSISKSPEGKPETQWQPAEGREPAIKPEQKRDAPPRIQLYAPEAIEKDAGKEPAGDNKKAAFPPIGQFADVKQNVYAGLRPPLDGLDWLRANEIRTVVHVFLPGADDSADKKQIEKRNMRYVPFEVSPQTLTREKAEEFIKLVRDHSAQGLFVYDTDGSLSGAMWYLYLRYGEVLDDDAAQIRASQYGLQTNRDGQHRDMWLAVQKVLADNNR